MMIKMKKISKNEEKFRFAKDKPWIQSILNHAHTHKSKFLPHIEEIFCSLVVKIDRKMFIYNSLYAICPSVSNIFWIFHHLNLTRFKAAWSRVSVLTIPSYTFVLVDFNLFSWSEMIADQLNNVNLQ